MSAGFAITFIESKCNRFYLEEFNGSHVTASKRCGLWMELNECFPDDVENIIMCKECEESNSESDQGYGSDIENEDSDRQL